MLSKSYFFLFFRAFISSYLVILKPHSLLKLNLYYEAVLFVQSLIVAPSYLFQLPQFLMFHLSCVAKYINTSTNRWQMEAPMGTEINPKAFKHKMSLRQAAEEKRKRKLKCFQREERTDCPFL